MGGGMSSFQGDAIKKKVAESLRVKERRRLRRWRRRRDSEGSAVSSLTAAQALHSSSTTDQSAHERAPMFNSAGWCRARSNEHSGGGGVGWGGLFTFCD